MRKYVKGLVCGMLVLSLAMPMGTTPEMVKIPNVYAADANFNVQEPPIEGMCGDNVKYSYNKETMTITVSGTGEMWDDFTFPQTVRNAYNLVIEKGVTSIGAYSFYFLFGELKNVKIADSVKTIKSGALAYVSGTLEIPASVTKVESNAIAGAERIVIKGDLKGYDYCALGSTDREEYVADPGLGYDTGMIEIVLHGTADDLGKAIANQCSPIVTIAKGNDKCTVKNNCLISKDGKVVYYGLDSVTGKNVTIPDSVEKICDAAFYGRVLDKVDLGKKLQEIGENAFYRADISRIKFPKSLKKIGDYAFYKSTIKNIKLNGKVSIGVAAFDKSKIIENKAGFKKTNTTISSSKVANAKYNISFAKVADATGYQIQIKAGKKTYKYDTKSNSYKAKVDKKIKKYYESVEDFYTDDSSLAITVTVRPYKVVKGKRVYGKISDKAILSWSN